MQTSPLLQSSPATATKELITFEGARVARSAYNAKYRTLSVSGSLIESIFMPRIGETPGAPAREVAIDLSGLMVFPGLINAHDHLDFSLFPRLGKGPYPNWREWAADIHNREQSSIEECLRVPRETRLWWGGIRNLLSGVTTVSHHNPYLPQVFKAAFPVHVPHDYGWAHSLAEIHKVVERFVQTPPEWPFILHLAEGTDQVSQQEFDVLEHLVPLNEHMVLVHCVGLTPQQWESAANSGTGIVWCPSSNLYTLGRTLTVGQVLKLPNVALGTDSPLTASGDLLDEIRLVHQELGVPAPFVYDLVTSRAAQLLRLRRGEGNLQTGAKADLIVVKDRQLTPAETLVQMSWRDVELVMEEGRIVLLSSSLAERIPYELREGMEEIFIDGVKRLLRAPVQKLLRQSSLNPEQTAGIGGRKLTLYGDAQLPRCTHQPSLTSSPSQAGLIVS
ncbi:MAG TPA: amidohydrolase family protein [Silvibacterium sp.]|nr:amidohydrolase family protein [Silvibacterium sp.]